MLNRSCFESVESYLEFYGLNFKIGSVACDFIPFKSDGYDLAGITIFSVIINIVRPLLHFPRKQRNGKSKKA